MSTVGVKELKNRLSHYLRRVRRGEEVIVTDRGRPVVVLHRVETATQDAHLEARLARLAADDVVAAAVRRPVRRLRRVEAKGRPVSEVILEERG
jgi:prevent-host-death family protein